MEKSEQMKIKQRIKLKITPVSLVPIATGAAFLILGTKDMDSCPGHPSLPEMLHIAGTITLSLGVMTNVGKLIVAYGLPSHRPFTKQETNVVNFFRLIRHFLTLSQIIIMIAGTIVIAPLASTIHPWNWKDPKVPFIYYISTFRGGGDKNVNFCLLLGPCLQLFREEGGQEIAI